MFWMRVACSAEMLNDAVLVRWEDKDEFLEALVLLVRDKGGWENLREHCLQTSDRCSYVVVVSPGSACAFCPTARPASHTSSKTSRHRW